MTIEPPVIPATGARRDRGTDPPGRSAAEGLRPSRARRGLVGTEPTPVPSQPMRAAARAGILGYGILAYILGMLSLAWMIAFLTGVVVPRTIDSGPGGALGPAIIINTLLVGLFAAQHTVMARRAFKAWLARCIPRSMVRSTFVLATAGCLGLLVWQWRPMPSVIWHLDAPAARAIITGAMALGWVIVFASTFLISHTDLFGLRQVWRNARQRAYSSPGFRVVGLYKIIRHPLMAGMLLALWATPTMTASHLLFAGLMTVYIILGTKAEERDLVTEYGEHYRQYRRAVPAFIPMPRRRG